MARTTKNDTQHLTSYEEAFDEKTFASLQDEDCYREFMAQASRLIASRQLSEDDANILFFRGIPKSQQKGIRRKLPAAQTKIQSPPPRDDILVLLQKEFDEDDILDDADTTDSSSSDDESSDESSEGSNSEDDKSIKSIRKSKEKVRFGTKKTPAVPTTTTTIEALAKQMQEIQLGQIRQIQELQLSQTNILRELAAARMAETNAAPVERKCFICDGTNVHKLGIRNCPDVPRLIEEGLAMYAPSGRLVRPDGSKLPRAPYGGGGVAKALRDE